jgi:flagellar hook assembly protein FlgD
MPFGIFSPDNDGFRDVMQFNYQLPEPGYSGTINVHNDQGALIKPLLNNSTLEVKGSIHWNGVDSEGTMVPVGIYLFHYALYHSNAEPITGVLPFVLARKLR